MKNELQQLVEAMCDGTVTHSERDRLQTLFDHDPAAVFYYVRYMELHARLQWHHRGMEVASQNSLVSSGSALRQLPPTSRVAQRIVGFIVRPTPASIAVATIVLGALVFAMALVGPPAYRHMTRRDEVGEELGKDRTIVAQLTETHQAVWGDGRIGVHAGAHLLAGHRLDLREGYAELQFKSGATMVIEGPALLEIASSNSSRVTSGKMACVVPEKAHGFVVETPVTTITDLGTEFSLEASASGVVVEVQVGKVRLDPRAQGSAQNSRLLRAGESLGIDASGKFHSAKIADGEIVRRFPSKQSTTRVLAVDFNSRKHNRVESTEAGFESFTLDGYSKTTTHSYGKFRVTVAGGGGSILNDRYRDPFVCGPEFRHKALYRDFVFGPARPGETLDVRVTGLVPKQLYAIAVWSFNPSSGTVYSNWSVNERLAVANYEMQPKIPPETVASNCLRMYTRADEQGEILISGQHHKAPTYSVVLNGLEISAVNQDEAPHDTKDQARRRD